MKTATMVGLILTFCMLGGKSVPAQAAVSATGQTGQANEEIKIEDITGWVGLDPAENRSGGDAGTAWGYYGHYCSGTACTGTDEDEPDAYSIVTWTWSPDDPDHPETTPTEFTLTATVTCTKKETVMVTRDGDCEEGPPNWVANSSVEASPPALGEEGGSGLCGSVSQSYSHWNPPVSYITIPKHHVSGPPDPIPAAYKDQSSSPVNIPWTVDPNDPATQTKKVSCKITSKFKGTATEIWVDQSRLQMKVTLQTSCQ